MAAISALADIKRIELKRGWNEIGSSAGDFESTIVEVEYLLFEADNVKNFYWIFNAFGDTIEGIAIEFEGGQRTFILVGEGAALSFGPGGNLVGTA